MKHETLKIKDECGIFKSLIGLDIKDAENKLGYWWILSNVVINGTTGFYIFNREPSGFVELRTDNNIVVTEYHNGAAELCIRRAEEYNKQN